MDTPAPKSVENPVALARAQRKRDSVMVCPVTVGASIWCFERLKRSSAPVRIEASFFNAPGNSRATEFQKLVDLLKADSLLMCAFAAANYDTFTLTFKNGSVIVLD